MECIKICKKCGNGYPLTEKYWYRARPTSSHPKGGWQSNCRNCWKIINKENKEKRNRK